MYSLIWCVSGASHRIPKNIFIMFEELWPELGRIPIQTHVPNCIRRVVKSWLHRIGQVHYSSRGQDQHLYQDPLTRITVVSDLRLEMCDAFIKPIQSFSTRKVIQFSLQRGLPRDDFTDHDNILLQDYLNYSSSALVPKRFIKRMFLF